MRAFLWRTWIPDTLKLDSISSVFKCVVLVFFVCGSSSAKVYLYPERIAKCTSRGSVIHHFPDRTFVRELSGPNSKLPMRFVTAFQGSNSQTAMATKFMCKLSLSRVLNQIINKVQSNVIPTTTFRWKGHHWYCSGTHPPLKCEAVTF